MADTLALGASAARRAGSTPVPSTYTETHQKHIESIISILFYHLSVIFIFSLEQEYEIFKLDLNWTRWFCNLGLCNLAGQPMGIRILLPAPFDRLKVNKKHPSITLGMFC